MPTRVRTHILEGPNIFFPRPAARFHINVAELCESPDASLRLRRMRRLLGNWFRTLAKAAGYQRLAVRVRPDVTPGHLVVVTPLGRLGRVTAFAEALDAIVDTALHTPDDLEQLITAQGATIAASPPGEAISAPRPRVPVVAVTGTNGKTTTVRMITHMARLQGISVAACSTDGVYHDGELIDGGDYSGPAGARLALAQPGVQLAVVETARGGILRRGFGVATNDVGVVTNVSADHLGLDGVDTLDDLAEVKSVVVRVTKRAGWAVLNGDDPRVAAMRQATRARPWLFTLDPDSPVGRSALSVGGRVTTVLADQIVVFGLERHPVVVCGVAEVPMTLGGISRANVENALAATSAALALGWPVDAVAEGLRTFRPDRNSPGRLNIYSIGDITVIIDLAHNEAGLASLLEAGRAFVQPGGRLLTSIGTAGDRPHSTFNGLGELAALNADVIVTKTSDHYQRGNDGTVEHAWLAEGVMRAGKTVVDAFPDETSALACLLDLAKPGDVVAAMVHQDKAETAALVLSRGGTPDDPETITAKLATGSNQPA